VSTGLVEIRLTWIYASLQSRAFGSVGPNSPEFMARIMARDGPGPSIRGSTAHGLTSSAPSCPTVGTLATIRFARCGLVPVQASGGGDHDDCGDPGRCCGQSQANAVRAEERRRIPRRAPLGRIVHISQAPLDRAWRWASRGRPGG